MNARTESLEPGIHRLPMAEYLADPCVVPSLSSGCAFRLVNESPFHAWHSHPRLGAAHRDFSSVADTGTTTHDLLLGGEGKICVINPADYRSKPTKECPEGAIPVGWTNGAIRAARDEARANGLTPMLAADMFSVRAAVEACRGFLAQSDLAGVLDDGESELTVIGRIGDTWLRTRPDWLNPKMRISLSFKTTKASVHADSFGRMAKSMGYLFAQEFYRRCLVEATGDDYRHVILAQEQTAPYACALYESAPAQIAIDSAQVSRALEIWRRCMESSQWPGYGRGVQRIEPKAWELAAEEERLQTEELESMG